MQIIWRRIKWHFCFEVDLQPTSNIFFLGSIYNFRSDFRLFCKSFRKVNKYANIYRALTSKLCDYQFTEIQDFNPFFNSVWYVMISVFTGNFYSRYLSRVWWLLPENYFWKNYWCLADFPRTFYELLGHCRVL